MSAGVYGHTTILMYGRRLFSMIFDKIAVNRHKKKWQQLIDEDRLISVKRVSGDNLLVLNMVEAVVNGRKIVNTVSNSYSIESSTGRALHSIVGPLQIGQAKYFGMNHDAVDFEEVYTPEILEMSLKAKFARKAEMTEDGKILLWIEYDAERPLRSMDFSSKPFLDAIQSVTGPMKPGDVYHFKSSESE